MCSYFSSFRPHLSLSSQKPKTFRSSKSSPSTKFLTTIRLLRLIFQSLGRRYIPFLYISQRVLARRFTPEMADSGGGAHRDQRQKSDNRDVRGNPISSLPYRPNFNLGILMCLRGILKSYENIALRKSRHQLLREFRLGSPMCSSGMIKSDENIALPHQNR